MARDILGLKLATEINDAFWHWRARSDDLKKLTDRRKVLRVLAFLRGEADVVFERHVVDTTVDVRCDHRSWRFERHNNEDRRVCWEEMNIELDDGLRAHNVLRSEPVLSERFRRPNCTPLSAIYWQYLVEFPELYPEEWGDYVTLFTGTVFWSSGLYKVRALQRTEGGKIEQLLLPVSHEYTLKENERVPVEVTPPF